MPIIPWLHSKMGFISQSICLPACLSLTFSQLVIFATSFGVQGHPSGQLQSEEPERKWNKQKESKPKPQQGFGSHARSGAVCADKELSVRVVVLRIPVEYSLSHTLAHTLQSHTQGNSTQR